MPFEVAVFLFWGLLVGIPLWGVILWFAVVVQGDIADVASLPTDAARGPLVAEGTLSRPGGTVRTHMGADVVGWVAEIRSVTRTGKTSVKATMCSVGHLDGMALTLGDGRTTLALDAANYHVSEDRLDLMNSVARATRPARLVRGEVVEQGEIPAAMAAGCELRPLREHETWTYIEHRLTAGPRYTFVGCREGAVLGPCANDNELAGHLLLGTRVDMLGTMLTTAVFAHAGLSLLTVFFSLVAGWTAWRHLRRYQQQAVRPW